MVENAIESGSFSSSQRPASTQSPRQPATQPTVQLLNWFQQPYNNAVATARTCYSSRVIYPEDVVENEARIKQRDAIAASIYKAGHHTTLQHSTFQFILEKVSRQFIWSFLHAHPFYNSEQVSQRYVEVKPGNNYIPELPKKTRSIYENTLEMQMQAYQELIKVLEQATLSQYKKIFPRRDLDDKKWRNAVKKRKMEVARYVLPVATFAHLYHTISGITLHRYHRVCEQMDVPIETRLVVERMVQEVLKVDPEFINNMEDQLPLEETFEYQALHAQTLDQTAGQHTAEFINEFDASLGKRTSLLLSYPQQAQETIASAIRSVLGLPSHQLSDTDAIALVLNPAQNPYLSESLNLNTMSKLMRSLHHCHMTFRKKISHTADSQDQRHRMTPGSRPILACHFQADTPDYIVPALIKESGEAQDLYHSTMQKTWEAISTLLNEGISVEKALYLLPNAFPIRFEESGDLMAFHHKWTTRLCYTAQEEIWNNCRDEVLQLKDIFPKIADWIHPPCTLRNMAKVTPFCPEGDRFCGVRVWKLQVDEFTRLL